VSTLAARFRVNDAQAECVARTAAHCCKQAARAWSLDGETQRMLDWAARLHEIGLSVAHSQYHKHGTYVTEKADLPGFSWQEQQQLAALIRGHRRKFPVQVFAALPTVSQQSAQRLCVLLRLAVLLHRARHDVEPRGLRLRAGKRALSVRFRHKRTFRHECNRCDNAFRVYFRIYVNRLGEDQSSTGCEPSI